MPFPRENFFEAIRGARRVLVLDLGFLGDTIHVIPALRCIREALPEAQLTAMAADHVKGILRVCPWLDAVEGYPRFPASPGLGWHFDFIQQLRAARYDAVINLNGSDRSAILTKLSGARLRLGRVPPRQSLFWPYCFTDVIQVPFAGPLYLQRWNCLKKSGFPGEAPIFDIRIPADVQNKAEELCDAKSGFVHISPFTTQDNKELSEDVLAEVINTLHARGRCVVVSSAPNERERAKLETLLGKVNTRPWRVFDGNLDLLELAAIIARSGVHLGGDSGALHVALMAGVPTVSWWRDYPGRDEWMPQGERHHGLIGQETPQGLTGISATAVIEAITKLTET